MARRTLGVDCGSAIVGWGVIEDSYNKLVHIGSGAIMTAKENDMQIRLKKIFKDFNKLIDLYKPEVIAIESLFFFKNQKTIVTVSQARGVIVLIAGLTSIPSYDYTPLQVKSAVTGYGRADKKQVAFMVGKILKLKDVPKLDDVTDALAVAICHANTRQ